MRLIYQFAIILVAFFLIIPGQILISNVTIKWSLITIVLLFIYRSLKFVQEGKVNIYFFKTSLYLLFLFLFFTIIALIHDLKDASMTSQLFLSMLMFSASYQLVIFHKYIFKNNYIDATLRTIIIVGLVNSLVMILVYLFPSVRDFVYTFIQVCEKCQNQLDLTERMRPSGFFYNGYSTLSLFNAVILIISFIYFTRQKIVNIISSTAVLIVLSLSIILSGRSGFVVMAVGIVYLLFYNNFISRAVKSRNIGIVVVSYICVVLLCVSYIDTSQYDDLIRWAFEFVFNYIEGGEVSTASTDTIFGRMYFLPEGELETIFGTGNFGRSTELPYIFSDSGYVLYIFGAGVLGLLLMFSFYVYVLRLVFSVNNCDQGIVFLISFLIITLLIGNFKDVYYLGHGGYGQLLFILLSLHIIERKDSHLAISGFPNNQIALTH